MKTKIAFESLATSLAVGLIVGGTSMAQQTPHAQTPAVPGQTPHAQTPAVPGQTPHAQTPAIPATPKAQAPAAPAPPTTPRTVAPPRTVTPGTANRQAPAVNYSQLGMYDLYRTHWDTRYQDPAFLTYREQLLRQQMTGNTPTPNLPVGRTPNQQTSLTYDQYVQNQALWNNARSSALAWQQSDVYWRMSDQYWRSADRRGLPGFDEYWTNSEAYWNDSNHYWDMYFGQFDKGTTGATSIDRERTNR